MERPDFEQWKPREVSRLLALVETERRYYQEMIAALPAPIAVLTSKYEIASSNRAFRKLAGMRNDELRGKPIDQVISAPGIVEQIAAGAAFVDPQPFDLLVSDKPYRCAAIPMRNWEDELETETLLLLEELGAAQPTPAPAAVATEPIPEPAPVEAPKAAPVEIGRAHV